MDVGMGGGIELQLSMDRGLQECAAVVGSYADISAYAGGAFANDHAASAESDDTVVAERAEAENGVGLHAWTEGRAVSEVYGRPVLIGSNRNDGDVGSVDAVHVE